MVHLSLLCFEEIASNATGRQFENVRYTYSGKRRTSRNSRGLGDKTPVFPRIIVPHFLQPSSTEQ